MIPYTTRQEKTEIIKRRIGDTLLKFLAAHELEIVDKHPTLGSHAADLAALRAEQADNRALSAMLRNMIAAPTIWRSEAKTLLAKVVFGRPEHVVNAASDGSPNPAPPEPES